MQLFGDGYVTEAILALQIHLRQSQNIRHVRSAKLEAVRGVLAAPRERSRIERADGANSSLGSLLILFNGGATEHEGVH